MQAYHPRCNLCDKEDMTVPFIVLPLPKLQFPGRIEGNRLAQHAVRKTRASFSTLGTSPHELRSPRGMKMRSDAPKGQTNTAQGNALGNISHQGSSPERAAQRSEWVALSGLILRGTLFPGRCSGLGLGRPVGVGNHIYAVGESHCTTSELGQTHANQFVAMRNLFANRMTAFRGNSQRSFDRLRMTVFF